MAIRPHIFILPLFYITKIVFMSCRPLPPLGEWFSAHALMLMRVAQLYPGEARPCALNVRNGQARLLLLCVRVLAPPCGYAQQAPPSARRTA
jgi:hypothetical protein